MTTTTIQLSDVLTEIRDRYHDALKSGRNWYYVRVWPDGSITGGCEPSYCVPESEYFHREKPHAVTAWSMTANYIPGPEDAVFEWEECDDDDAEFWLDAKDGIAYDRDATHTRPYKLGDAFGDEPEFDEKEIVSRLEDAGYAVE